MCNNILLFSQPLIWSILHATLKGTEFSPEVLAHSAKPRCIKRQWEAACTAIDGGGASNVRTEDQQTCDGKTFHANQPDYIHKLVTGRFDDPTR